jgi:hypothetical protein
MFLSDALKNAGCRPPDRVPEMLGAGGTAYGPSQLPSELGVNRVNMSYREGGESALTEEEEEW